MTKISGQSFLAGKWVTPSGTSFTSINPKTGESSDLFYTSQVAEINGALDAALLAFETYRKMSGAQIGAFLNAIADEIEGLGDVLLETGDRESGLGIPRMTGERGRTCGQIRAFANIAIKGQWTQPSIDTALPDRQPIPKPDIRRMMRPIGPVVVFGASNFPFAFGSLGGDTASALAGGNPVVVKGHPSHPATSELFARAVESAAIKTKMPAGVFSLLQGIGNDLGSELVKHPATEAVGFTGSFRGGKALMDLAAARKRPIPVYAEMGSINPLFITKNALENRAEALAQGLAGSVCMGMGQFCTSPGVVITMKNEKFEQVLKGTLDATPRGTMLNAGIALAYASGLGRLKSNAKVKWLNETTIKAGEMSPPHAVFKTSAQNFLQDESLSEEIFGPVTLFVECSTQDEMLAIARHLEGNLTATIHAQGDESIAKELTDILELKVGRIVFNGFPTGVEVCPSMQHGGPFPASSVGSATSVGADAIVRFARFVAYQNIPDGILPPALQNKNPMKLVRRLNGELTDQAIQ